MTERLFRNDGGAAVERAARLQEENAQLRQQLVYERSQRQATTVRKPRGGLLGLVLVAIVALFMLGLVGGMVAFFVMRSPPVPKAPVIVAVEPAAAPAATDSSGSNFDRTAAATALGTAQIESCKRPEGPTGSGHIKVTFANDGSVSAVVLDAGPFNGTLAGQCIENRFSLARVPPFTGPPVTVGKSFTIN
jgi:hypothetical protein